MKVKRGGTDYEEKTDYPFACIHRSDRLWAASRNASSQVYMAETAAAYDTASGAGNGMPASYSKSATTNFDSEASFDDSDSVQVIRNDNPVPDPEKNPDTDPSDSENASAETSQTPMERKLIRNVNMDLETREFDASQNPLPMR